MRNERLHRLTWISVLSALAFILVAFGRVWIPPFQTFLKFDFGDIPAVIAGYVLGPVAGLTVETLKALLFLISGTAQEGWVGVMANFFAGGSLVIATSLVNRMVDPQRNRHFAWGLISAVVGTLIMTALLIPLNALLVYPAWGMKGAAAWSGALTISTPFNLFKGFASCVISLAFYRRLEPFMLGRWSRRAA
jgi:riboflavin transporter FmnP